MYGPLNRYFGKNKEYLVHDRQSSIRLKVRPVARGASAPAPPVFGRSVNPISTRGGTLSPPSTKSPLRFSDLATALKV